MFFNIAGMYCYEYEHPISGCAEYTLPPQNHFPKFLLTATKVNPNPEGLRCKSYKVDTSRPKRWQFFQLFYEEGNYRASRHMTNSVATRRQRKPMPVFQQFLIDLFLKVVNI